MFDQVVERLHVPEWASEPVHVDAARVITRLHVHPVWVGSSRDHHRRMGLLADDHEGEWRPFGLDLFLSVDEGGV